MFAETPELYDRIYGSFKDYEAEASQIAELLALEIPGARSVLDVGCGTAEHARLLHTRHGYLVAGLDIEPRFIGLARKKLPGADFWTEDMAEFSLGRSFDVILCLFSAIGYVVTLDRLESALRSFRAHVSPGGLVLVEPWFQPAAWSHGRVFVHTAESDDLSVVWMSHSGHDGGRSILDFHYLIGTRDGVEHRTERHELGLFTKEEMEAAFVAAGFDSVEHDPEGLIGRGMYLARVAL